MVNTEHFLLIAGDTQHWDDEMRQVVAAGGSLTDVQVNQHQRGRLFAEVVHSSIYGWYVRSGTSLMGDMLLCPTRERCGPLDGSLEQALAWCQVWVAEDPRNREAYVRRSSITQAADDRLDYYFPTYGEQKRALKANR